jgi:hypothetical protein
MASPVHSVQGQDLNVNKQSPRAFRKKNGGGQFCCVPHCSNQSGNDKQNNVKRSYYRFPKRDSKQFRLWIMAIRRDNWEYREWHRICSDHFKGGKILMKNLQIIIYIMTFL